MNLNWKTMDSFVWPRMFWDERAFRLLLKKQLEGAESIMVEELPVEHQDKRRMFPQGQHTADTAAVGRIELTYNWQQG